jgi:transketolase
VLAFAKEHGTLITVEEHQRAGGMGSAIAEYLSEIHPTNVIRLGIDDCFGESGTVEELWRRFKIDSESIIFSALDSINIKNL